MSIPIWLVLDRNWGIHAFSDERAAKKFRDADSSLQQKDIIKVNVDEQAKFTSQTLHDLSVYYFSNLAASDAHNLFASPSNKSSETTEGILHVSEHGDARLDIAVAASSLELAKKIAVTRLTALIDDGFVASCKRSAERASFEMESPSVVWVRRDLSKH